MTTHPAHIQLSVFSGSSVLIVFHRELYASSWRGLNVLWGMPARPAAEVLYRVL